MTPHTPKPTPLNLLTFLTLLLLSSTLQGQSTEKITYKTIGNTALNLEILSPSGPMSDEGFPAIVFFFGGGWNGGTPEQFRPHAEYFVKRGMVTILADYRVKNKHQASPFESLMDAKSAIRFIRKNVNKWNINSHQIVASGGSAGGHLAAATAIIEAYNDPIDDLKISCKPDALVLFNPVIDNGPGGYGYERIGNAYHDFSPLHNVRKDLPPTIFFLGTKDALIPVETGNYYKTMMERTGNRCDLHLYNGAGHGFFNVRNQVFYSHTIDKTDRFLQSIGFLNAKTLRPVIDTLGFAQYDWQMDSIVSRLSSRIGTTDESTWKAVIAPHDDYKYAGELTMQALAGIKAKTVILFGVAHKARNFNLEDKIIFGSHSHWQAPYGNIPVSDMREEIMKGMDEKYWMVHDSMQEIEHSLEAITPFLQYQNRLTEIVPILVPYMDYKQMGRISKQMSQVLSKILKERGLEFGKDVAIVISNDAVHYGDEDWGGKNMAPFGSDDAGNKKALELEKEIISTCLVGDMSSSKMKKFTEYTIQKDDHKEYKWTWCGRYALPLGILVANQLSEIVSETPLSGTFLNYATSIDHAHYPVEDIGMGTTAIATKRHWVGYAAIGYK